MRKKKNAYRALVANKQGRRQPGRTRRKWDNRTGSYRSRMRGCGVDSSDLKTGANDGPV
jgi:hypothetical protein